MVDAETADAVAVVPRAELHDRRRARVALGLVVALSVPLLFAGLGGPALVDPDEPYYAVPAAEMIRTQTWSIPVFRGQPWLDKPPLFYWAVAGAYELLGVSEGAARLPSALAALACALLVAALPRRKEDAHDVARLAALILTSTLGFALLARAAITDMLLTALLTAGMLCTARSLSTGRAVFAALAGAAFGLATLTKGPVGIVVPGVALVAYAVVGRFRGGSARLFPAARASGLLRPAWIASATAGFAVTAAPWYVLAATKYPDLLFGTFLRGGNVGRFLSPERTSFPFFYAVVLLVGFLPWSGALPAALRDALRLSRGRVADDGFDAAFLLCWLAGVLLPFSLSASKLASYALPAFPPLALLLASYWSRAFEPGRKRSRWSAPRTAGLVSLFLALLVAIALGIASERPTWSAARLPALAIGACLTCGAAAALAAIRKGSLRALLAIHAATAACAVLVLWLGVLPALEPWQSNRSLAEALAARDLEQQVVGAYRVHDVSLDYYLGGARLRYEDFEQVASAAREHPDRLWIVRTADLPEVLRDPRCRATVALEGANRCAVRLSPVELSRT